MKITAPREALASALTPAARAAGSGSAEMLSRLRLEVLLADDGEATLVVTGGDNERSVRTRLKVTADEAVSVYVPAQLIAGLTKDLGGDTIDLEITDQEVNIGHESGSYRIPVYTDEGPRFPAAGTGSSFTITGSSLADAIGRVAGAASKDAARGVLTAVRLEASADVLTLVATDSFRLAVVRRTIPEIAETIEATLPAAVLDTAARLLAKSGEVTVRFDERCVSFDAGSVEVTGVQLAGTYPAWPKLMANTPTQVVTVSKDAMIEKIRRVARFAPTVDITVDPQGELAISGTGVGSALERCSCGFSGTEPLSLRFNAGYILDAVLWTVGEDITVTVKDATSPVWVRGNDDQTTVVMPLRK